MDPEVLIMITYNSTCYLFATGLRGIAQKAAILVRVYNKTDSAITQIAKRERRRERLFLQIFNIIAASILLRK